MASPGIDPKKVFAPRYQRLMEQAQGATEAMLEEQRSPAGLSALVWSLYQTAEREIAEAQAVAVQRAAEGKGCAPACAKGCFYCCHQVVGTVAPEVLVLADWIRANFSPEEITALRERIEGYRQTLEGLSGHARLKPLARCPMLVDGICSVHEARPLVCRASNSTDVKVCIAAYESGQNPAPPPFLHTQRSAGRSVRLGMRLGLARKKMPGDIVELTLAMGIALDHPDSAVRWLAGEDVFAEAEGPMGRSAEVAEILEAQDRAAEIPKTEP
ncbi:MAG: hypothetical protein HYR64_01980 [Fimbriimonas ginsengisoli]|uniref:YkgJ family cysteine cluster protein n=1 Tax=Fimbriimonas ginsengisoli TaxID=1005039 RepID=A0A931LVX6_FIMGI|nr:hypothetical protein [Fimbriimonas ginsengisoli]